MDEDKFKTIMIDPYEEQFKSILPEEQIIEEEEIYDDSKEEIIFPRKEKPVKKGPSNTEKISATIKVFNKTVIGRMIRTAKRKIANKKIDYKKRLVSGALATTLLVSGTFLAAKGHERSKEKENTRQTRIEELIGNNCLIRDENNSTTINLENEDRYDNLLPYGTNPGNEIAKEYYNEIINACKTSNISEDIELRKFLNSFVEKGSEQTNEDYYNYVTKLITEIKNGNYNPTYNQDDLLVGGKVFTYGEYENNSPRR